MPRRLVDPGESVALMRPSATPRLDASRASVGQTSSLLKTRAVGSSASSVARASPVPSKGSTSRKSTFNPAANRSALGEK